MTADLVLEEKLESIRRCLERAHAKLPPTVQALAADLDAQDIVTVNLERAVQLSVDVAMHMLSARTAPAPRTMADAFTVLADQGIIAPETATRMMKAVGFRNLAVHAYRQLDWAIVHAIVVNHLDDFRRFMREVVAAAGV